MPAPTSRTGPSRPASRPSTRRSTPRAVFSGSSSFVQPDEPRRQRRICDRVVATVERRFVRDRFIVLSTSEAILEQLHESAPELTLGLAGWFEGVGDLQRAAQLGCGQIAVPVATGSAWLVQAAHVLGIEVIGWLGNTGEEITTFVEWGVDAIVSDFPSVAKHALAPR